MSSCINAIPFPLQIVTSIEEARNMQATAPSSDGKGRAKYKFKGETANEMSVNKVGK